jgi:hypothetical protein
MLLGAAQGQISQHELTEQATAFPSACRLCSALIHNDWFVFP